MIEQDIQRDPQIRYNHPLSVPKERRVADMQEGDYFETRSNPETLYVMPTTTSDFQCRLGYKTVVRFGTMWPIVTELPLEFPVFKVNVEMDIKARFAP